MNKLMYIFVYLIVFSCNSKSKLKLIEGTWRYEDTNKVCEIAFKNDYYIKTIWNDDIITESKGKYFINENPSNQYKTITLVPDLYFSHGDTIILPCENFNLIKISDSTLIIHKTSQQVQVLGHERKRANLNEIYKRILSSQIYQ